MGHRGSVRGPGDVREEPGAGGDPQQVGDAGRAGLHLPGAAGPERGEVRGGGVVQGRSPDLQRRRPGLLGEPEPDPRAEHLGHLGLPGHPDGSRGGLPRRRRPARRGHRPALPGRKLRPARSG
ncbi:unnamed protein product [Cuscuta epithymum]|uniref:Uncharacterized protein n=1 Tax=Cuscuta epithymum TaxID=186058 RepID=A0AAV0G1A2_9ASTE|nr:unnamed protein product [Cuscuta epithymum]